MRHAQRAAGGGAGSGGGAITAWAADNIDNSRLPSRRPPPKLPLS